MNQQRTVYIPPNLIYKNYDPLQIGVEHIFSQRYSIVKQTVDEQKVKCDKDFIVEARNYLQNG